MHREKKSFFFGFSRWKRRHIVSFFDAKILFASTLSDALTKGLNTESHIYIWGKKPFDEVERYAQKYHIPLSRVEDGFIRSVSLGSDLTKAYSLVVDSRGIYFDPTKESDLEVLLNTFVFSEEMLERSRKLQHYLIDNKISKYNIYQDKKIQLSGYHEGQTIVMVPGQVEDDASVLLGADGMTNLELLKEVRSNNNKAYIIYKPHPDVLAGNRKGQIEEHSVLQYADHIITEASLDSVLMLSDEVHTMTSLVGFEALIRGKKVTTYGLPFYAGWGLSTDMRSCRRRQRRLTLDMLVAGALICYPHYIHPQRNNRCEVEAVLDVLDKERNRYNTDIFYRFRINFRNWISRKIQLMIKVILGE